jgi:hypothetical protein
MTKMTFMTMAMIALGMLCACAMAQDAEGSLTQPFESAYTGNDATGSHVIALWQFMPGKETEDGSGHGHELQVKGAEFDEQGRFDSCLESFRGWPDTDEKHGVVVKNHGTLTPKGAFTIEMWLKPKADLDGYPESFLIDKKYVADTDYQLTLSPADKTGKRNLRLRLGFGSESEVFTSESIIYDQDVWYHIACTYDGAGTVQFFRDGIVVGRVEKPGRGAIVAGKHDLTIGDRVGSYYHGFPGYLDQVRICNGVLEFRSVKMEVASHRRAFLRMEKDAQVQFEVTNLQRQKLSGAVVKISLDYGPYQRFELPEIAGGGSATVSYVLDTSGRPGQAKLVAQLEVPGDEPLVSRQSFDLDIVPRPLPHRMPVVMWGVGGVSNVLEEMDRLKDIGFTHCLGLSADFGKIWDAGQPVQAASDDQVAEAYDMLDKALVNDLHIIEGLSPGRWAVGKEEFRQVDREGKPYDSDRISVNGLYPEVQKFCYNVGASVARTYAEFPAFEGAMVHTEVRGASKPSFSDMDRAAFRKHSGLDIPAEITTARGVRYTNLKDFPSDRVIADDHPILVYYKWFWERGDGWTELHTQLHRGLQTCGREEFWTFHDPACRVASKWGSGGEVDFLSHWTYSYPDPIRIGLCTDELFAMAAGGREGQQVMKMTQVIWYRGQTAPMPGTEAQVVDATFDDHDHGPKASDKPDQGKYRARWEKEIPDAAFITIAPLQMREAFWAKMARQIQGIMYHGWQSLVYTGTHSSYRHTHPGTHRELKRLVETVLQPLGPALMQVPDRQSDVAFLESFSSQMFAGRGTYGWNGGWAGDVYLILHYAQLQPQVIYDETILRDGLGHYKVLVMADCDVLTESVAKAVQQFQDRGGIVVGDENLCPAIKPDILLQSHTRPKEADMAKNMNLEAAENLRTELDAHYKRYAGSSDPNIITRVRRYGSTDYVFAVNDTREFGDYVGQHGLVMERGLPLDATVYVNSPTGHVYDLVGHRELRVDKAKEHLAIPWQFGPCQGRVFMVTERAIDKVEIQAPQTVKQKQTVAVNIAVVDEAGNTIDAVVPLDVQIRDADGQKAEFSGYYGAAGGKLQLNLDIAPNDARGMWQVAVTELAAGATSYAYFRVIE